MSKIYFRFIVSEPSTLCRLILYWLSWSISGGSSTNILGCQNFGWITFLVHFFVQKCYIGSLVFSVLNWFQSFKNWCNLIFFVKFLEAKQGCFIKIDTRIMSITLTKKIIIHNYNFYGKTLIQSNKFNQKNQIASIFQKSEPNWN